MEQSEYLRSWMKRGARQGIRETVRREAADHRVTLEQILKERFSKDAGPQALTRVTNEADLEILKTWMVQAAVAKSWNAFVAADGWK